jgi:endonuclease/exonuclease/phosphatase family metal-dependent hydrolase
VILASYNVENLFLRARALNEQDYAAGKPALLAQAQLNAIFGKGKYTTADKAKVLALLKELGLDKKDDGGQFAILRQNHGHLLKRPKSGPVEVVAEGRGDWIGWVDLKIEEVNEVATRMTAKVIHDVGADVIAVVEAESRPALVRFSDGLMPTAGGTPYDHVMLIDGNDERGIDVGIMTRKGFSITSINSHVDDEDSNGRIFSRDCASYTITTPNGNTIVVLVNHFKSKGFGGQASSDARRKRQAAQVKDIYESLVASGQKLVAVVGDFNDTPDSEPLKSLVKQTDLRDISEHGNFDDGAGGTRPGTFGNGTKTQKIDYILLSPALFAATQRGGIFRKGVWAGKNGDLWEHYDEITKAEEAASDHAAIWAEINV